MSSDRVPGNGTGDYETRGNQRLESEGERERLIDTPSSSYYYSAINGVEEGDIVGEPRKKMKNKYKYQIYVVTLILTFIGCFSILNLIMLIPRSEELVNQSVEMDIKSVELNSLTTDGLVLRVQGVNIMDYDSIENPYFKNLFKMGGGLFNTANINLKSVNLTTQIDGKLVDIGVVKIPDFNVNIEHLEKTDLDLLVTVKPNTKEILGLVKQFLKDPDQIFKIDGISAVKIHLGHIPIGEFKISFRQDVIGGKYIKFDEHDFSVKQLSFDNDESQQGYNITFVVNLPNPIQYKLFGFDVPSLGWEILIKDCFGKHTISLLDGPVFSDNFKLSPLEKELNINMATYVGHLNPRLTEQCSFDFEGTPMSILVDEFVNNKSVPVLVKNSKGSKEFPGFINEFLKSFEFNIDYLSNFKTSNIIHNVSLDNLNFQFQNGDTNKPVINGDINLFIKPPYKVKDFGISKIKGVPSLYHADIKFGELHLDEWHDCFNMDTPDDLLFVRFTLNQEELKITNRKVFGEVLNEVLAKGSSKVFIDAILDCLISTLLGEFELDQLHASSDADITRGFLLRGFGLLDLLG